MFCGATWTEKPLVSKVYFFWLDEVCSKKKYLVCDFFQIPQDSNMKV
jgi:hypothetical protein